MLFDNINRENPDELFLALHLFSANVAFLSAVTMSLLEETMKLMASSPECTEWDEVDKIFDYWFKSLNRDHYYQTLPEKFPRLMWCMCRLVYILFTEKLKMILSLFFYRTDLKSNCRAHFSLLRSRHGSQIWPIRRNSTSIFI